MKSLSLGVLLASVLLTGCGGGGGPLGVNFPNNAVLAEATQENGEKVAKATVSRSASYGLNNIDDSSGANTSLIARNISNILSKSVENLPQSNALNSIGSIIEDCDIKGTISGSFNADTGAYAITYTNCKNTGFDTITGSLSGTIEFIKLNGEDELKKAALEVKSALSMKKNDIVYSTMQVGSFMNVEYSVAGDDTEDVTITLSAIGVENNQKYGCKDCKFHVKLLTNHDIQIYQTKGQLYIGNNLEAYVTYDTSYNMSATPFVFSNNDGRVNDGGIARYTAKDNKTIGIKAESGVVNLYIDGTFSKEIDL